MTQMPRAKKIGQVEAGHIDESDMMVVVMGRLVNKKKRMLV